MKRSRLQPRDWLHREERTVNPDGTVTLQCYRRRVLEVRGAQLRLSGIERQDGEQWLAYGGLLGGPSTTSAERLTSSGYVPGRGTPKV